MNPTSKDIAKIIEDSGLFTLDQGHNLFYSRLPSQPQNCVAVADNPGGEPMLTLDKDTSDYYYSSVTVYVRDVSYDEGYTLVFQIMQYLHAQSQIVIGTTYYALIRALSDPQLFGYDDNDRPVFLVNFEVQRRTNTVTT